MTKHELVGRLYAENPCPVWLVMVEKNFSGLVYSGKVYAKRGRLQVRDTPGLTLRGELVEYTILHWFRRTWYKQLGTDKYGIWLPGRTWILNPLTGQEIRPRLYLAGSPEEAEEIRWGVAGKLAREYEDLLTRREELQEAFHRKLGAIDKRIDEIKRKV